MRAFHGWWVWVAVIGNGLVGLGGLGLAMAKQAPGPVFTVARNAAIGAMLIQVAAGFLLFNQGIEPASIHTFYGFLILFSYTFAYIYRAQLERRPALGYGLILLWVMGLGLQAWNNAG